MSNEDVEFFFIDITKKAGKPVLKYVFNNTIIMTFIACTIIVYIAWRTELKEIILPTLMIAGVFIHVDVWMKSDELNEAGQVSLDLPPPQALSVNLIKEPNDNNNPGSTSKDDMIKCKKIDKSCSSDSKANAPVVEFPIIEISQDFAGLVNLARNAKVISEAIWTLIKEGSSPSANASIADRLLLGMLIYLRMHESIAFCLIYGLLIINLVEDIPLVNKIFTFNNWFFFLEDMKLYSNAFLGGFVATLIALYVLDDGGANNKGTTSAGIVTTVVLSTIVWILYIDLF